MREKALSAVFSLTILESTFSGYIHPIEVFPANTQPDPLVEVEITDDPLGIGIPVDFL